MRSTKSEKGGFVPWILNVLHVRIVFVQIPPRIAGNTLTATWFDGGIQKCESSHTCESNKDSISDCVCAHFQYILLLLVLSVPKERERLCDWLKVLSCHFFGCLKFSVFECFLI